MSDTQTPTPSNVDTMTRKAAEISAIAKEMAEMNEQKGEGGSKIILAIILIVVVVMVFINGQKIANVTVAITNLGQNINHLGDCITKMTCNPGGGVTVPKPTTVEPANATTDVNTKAITPAECAKQVENEEVAARKKRQNLVAKLQKKRSLAMERLGYAVDAFQTQRQEIETAISKITAIDQPATVTTAVPAPQSPIIPAPAVTKTSPPLPIPPPPAPAPNGKKGKVEDYKRP